MLTITIDSRIRFSVVQETSPNFTRFLAEVKRDMLIDNPAYFEAEKMGRSTRGIPSRICLSEYNDITKEISLPRGYAGQMIRMLKQHGLEYVLVENRAQLPAVRFDSRIKLRHYQAPAIDAVLKGTQGILEAPAGSGKTEMGLEIVARIGQPTLWLTHTKDLAEQVAARAESRLGVPRDEIGMLGCGQEKVGPRLTVGIIQKMAKMNLAPLARKFGLVILDECHHTGGAATWQAIINQMPARYRYGVTATLKRGDGLQVITERTIGPTLYKIERFAVEASGGVIIPQLRVIKTGIESEVWQKYEERVAKWEELCEQFRERGMSEPRKPVAPYGDILNEILTNNQRNALILKVLKEECPGHCSLVLSERVDHCEFLAKHSYSGLRVAVIHGKMSKKARQEILGKMNQGELDVLFAVDIAKEGLDIPRLDRLFLVAGGRNEAELEQKIGRIQRTFPGKRDAVVFDFVDEKIGVLRAQYWARRKVYKRLGMLGSAETRKAI